MTRELGEEMEHFAAEEWADFARKLGIKEKRLAMEEHLNSGCETCTATLHFWNETARSASCDPAYEPPSYAVRNVKAIGGLYLSRPGRSRSIGLAELILDSAWAGSAAGVRSSGTAPSQFLYKFGTVNIDLRAEQIPASSRISIVGQVVDESQNGQMIADVRVAVLYENGVPQATTTNKFGEFQLECEFVSTMYLTLQLNQRLEIWVPLNQFKGEHTQGTWS